ncbi:MAG: hypothetical protein AB7N80_05915, partial [Bdellovibrionales bacterium]
MKLSKWLSVLVFLWTGTSVAGPRELAMDFLLGKQQGKPLSTRMSLFEASTPIAADPRCGPGTSMECTEFVAGNSPNAEERREAARVCIGNYGVDCVRFIAGTSPNRDERRSAALACRNVQDIECVVFVAGNSPNHDERLQAGEACRNADAECVKFVAGNSPNREERVA